MNTLTFMVSGNRLKLLSGYSPVSGEKGYSTLKFIFDKEWEGVESIYVSQFFDVENAPDPVHAVISNGIAVVNIHEELRNQSGKLHIGVVGTVSDGSGVVIDTNIAHVAVGEGVYLNGTESTKLIQDLIEYLASIESNLLTKGNQVGTENLKDRAVTTDKLADKAVTTDKLDTASVTGGKLADRAVNTGHIVDGAVTSDKLAKNSVKGGHIEDGSIGTDQILDGAVTNAKLATNCVSTDKMQDGAVTSGKLADKAVKTANLDTASVTGGKLADRAVNTGHIVDGAVTSDKLAKNSVKGGHIEDGSIGTDQILDGAVGSAKLATNSISAEKIKDGAVTSEKLADKAVKTANLDTESVTGGKLADRAVNTGHIVDGAVTEEKLSDEVRHLINDKPDVNCHATFFDISDDGELSLKEEFQAGGENNAALPADLIIPGCVNEIAVDRLSSGMFLENKVINSITLPDSVYEIPEQFCNMAVNLKFVNNTAHIKKIGDRAFRNCRLEKAVFPNLEEINGTLAFYQNPHLTFADVGKVTEIPSKTFKHCMYLSKISASGGKLTNLGLEALFSTVSLRNTDFMASVTSVGDKALALSKLEYDFDSLVNCTFGTNATHRQYNPTDYWSECVKTPCENPIPVQFCQRDERWAGVKFYNDTYNFADHGCTIMSSIHAVCGLYNKTLDSPVDFGALVNNPGIWDGYRPNTDYLAPVLNGIGNTNPAYKVTATYYNDGWTKERVQALYDALASGGYAVVEIGAPANHGVLVYGIDDKGDVLVLDSEQRHHYDASLPIKYTLPFHKLIAQNSSFVIIQK